MSDRTMALAAAWRRQGFLLGGLLLVLFGLYYATFESMVKIWLRSETFAHGFIIAPISLWLIWRIKDRILASEPQANYVGIPILLMVGFIWLLANYVGVLAIEQLAAVAMIPVVIFTLLGWRATKTMMFPLFFLLFSVPLGEEITPYLIDFTANFTVTLIKLVGIPIYREGNFFELPSGSWSVIAACSGVRYLIASVTLGVLYAYLNYQSPLKRGVFVAVSFVVPVIANGLRAFLIVMLGHFSDMQLATGVDHLIYGWIFFGVVIAIMFYVGSFWRDDETSQRNSSVDMRFGDLDYASVGSKLVVIFAGIMLVVWPIKLHLEQKSVDLSNVAQIDLRAPAGWKLQNGAAPVWEPAYHNLDREFSAVYSNGVGGEVVLYIGYYAEQRQDAELGNYNNVLVKEKDETWRVVEQRAHALPLAPENSKLPVAILISNTNRLMASYFYYLDGIVVTNKYETKLLQVKAKLLGGRNDAAVVALSTNIQGNAESAAKLLEEFATVALPMIKATLNDMGHGS